MENRQKLDRGALQEREQAQHGITGGLSMGQRSSLEGGWIPEVLGTSYSMDLFDHMLRDY